MRPDLVGKLPPTDTRLRTDQRLYEEGHLKEANNEKNRLEERQRAIAKLRKEAGVEHKAHYFDFVDSQDKPGTKEHRFKNKYWEDREKGNWGHLPELYGKETPTELGKFI